MTRPIPLFYASTALRKADVLEDESRIGRVRFGADIVDHKLDGGLIRGGLHELYAASVEDGSAATAFAAMLGTRAMGDQRPLLWVCEDRGVRGAGRLNAPGLIELGCDPARIIMVTAADTLGLLCAASDSIKCGQVGAVVIEPWGKAALLDLTASRRLAMAATASGVFTLVVRVDAAPMPSAAHSRWQVAAAPATPLAANAPGHPACDIALLRHRGGIIGFEARLEWNRDTKSFAPLSGSVPALAVIGADQARKAA